MSPNLAGGKLFMMGSMAALVLNDTMTKDHGGAGGPLVQLLFLRGVIFDPH